MKQPGAETAIRIFGSEVAVIHGEVQRYPSIETGGDLFGSFTHGGLPVVWLASGPGPAAVRQRLEFEQDARFRSMWQKELMERFALQYVGSWHSHHSIGLKVPSSGDIGAVQAYAERHQRRRYVEIIVTNEGGRIQLWPYLFPNAIDGRHVLVPLKPLIGVSPLRAHLGDREASFSGAAPAAMSAGRVVLPAGLRDELLRWQAQNPIAGGFDMEERDGKLLVVLPLEPELPECELMFVMTKQPERVVEAMVEDADGHRVNLRTMVDFERLQLGRDALTQLMAAARSAAWHAGTLR